MLACAQGPLCLRLIVQRPRAGKLIPNINLTENLADTLYFTNVNYIIHN